MNAPTLDKFGAYITDANGEIVRDDATIAPSGGGAGAGVSESVAHSITAPPTGGIK